MPPLHLSFAGHPECLHEHSPPGTAGWMHLAHHPWMDLFKNVTLDGSLEYLDVLGGKSLHHSLTVTSRCPHDAVVLQTFWVYVSQSLICSLFMFVDMTLLCWSFSKSLLIPGFHVANHYNRPPQVLCKGPQGILVHHSHGELAGLVKAPSHSLGFTNGFGVHQWVKSPSRSMSCGLRNDFLLAMDMAKVAGALAIVKVETSMLCVKIGCR